MRQWMIRQLDRVVALGIEIFLVLLFAWESVLEFHHDPHTCHHHHCYTCAQISAVKSIIHYISQYRLSIVTSAIKITVDKSRISTEYQEAKTVSLVSLKIRMDN